MPSSGRTVVGNPWLVRHSAMVAGHSDSVMMRSIAGRGGRSSVGTDESADNHASSTCSSIASLFFSSRGSDVSSRSGGCVSLLHAAVPSSRSRLAAASVVRPDERSCFMVPIEVVHPAMIHMMRSRAFTTAPAGPSNNAAVCRNSHSYDGLPQRLVQLIHRAVVPTWTDINDAVLDFPMLHVTGCQASHV